MAVRGDEDADNNQTYAPVNIERLLWNAKGQFFIDAKKPTDLEPTDLLSAAGLAMSTFGWSATLMR